MSKFFLTIICFFFVLDLLGGQNLSQFEEIVRNKDSQKLHRFVENWERESLKKLKDQKKENEEFYLLYEFFVSLADSAEIYPFVKERTDSRWRIIQDSLRIKIYEKINVNKVPLPEGINFDEIKILANGEKLSKDFYVELCPNFGEGENLLLLETESGKSLEKFLNEYRIKFYDVIVKKEEEAVQKYEFAKRIREMIGKKIGFDFFIDGILEWCLVDFPVVEEIEFDKTLKKAIIRYGYLLDGGFALVERKEVGAKWELIYSSNTWIR